MNILIMASSSGILSYHLSQLSIGLRRRGHQVTVVSGGREQVSGLSTALSEAQIERLISCHIDKTMIHDIYGTRNDLRGILETREVDVIHAQDLLQTFVAHLAAKALPHNKRPAVVTSIHYLPPENILRGSLRWTLMTRLLNRCAEIVLPVSTYTRNRLIEHGLNPKKTVVVHNGIDLDSFDNLERTADADLDKLEGKPSIVSVGNLTRIKGQKYYIMAAKRVLEKHLAAFYVIGDGPERRHLEKLADSLGIMSSVVFTGSIYWPRIYRVLSSVADICVSSSLSENFPFYLLECMAARKPIVATNVGGVAEAITDGVNGYLAASRDPDSLATGILRLIEDKSQAQKMGAMGRRLVEQRFSMPVLTEKLSQIYELQ